MTQYRLTKQAKERIRDYLRPQLGMWTLSLEDCNKLFTDLEEAASVTWKETNSRHLPVTYVIEGDITLSRVPSEVKVYMVDFTAEEPPQAAQGTWIMQVPVITTRHIPQGLAEWLRDHEFDDDVADMPGGWMICVHTDIDYVDLDPWGAMERLKQFMKLNYPEMIADGLAWIRFDADGDEYAGLEDYDW